MARFVRGFSSAAGADIARTISTAMENIGLELNATQINGKDIGDLAVIDEATGKIPVSVMPTEVVQVDNTGKIPTKSLPTTLVLVDDFINTRAFPAVGDINKLYLAQDTDLLYRWDSVTSSYVLFIADTDNLQKQINEKASNDILVAGFNSIASSNNTTAAYVNSLLV